MLVSDKNNATTYVDANLVIIFFINALVEICAEYFQLKTIIFITKPLIPIFLMLLYWETSFKKDKLFFATLFFSVITNLLFIPNSDSFLFYGIIAFTIHRILLLIYVFKIITIKNYKPLLLATIPTLLLFVYLYFVSSYFPKNSVPILFVQVILLAIFGGVALSGYILDDNKQNSYLMICALLFTALQFVIFIEKYYLHTIQIPILRPIAMTLNVFAFYSFYKFILVAEENKLHNN